MARVQGWWGTAPLTVGACGLMLLAFGAKWVVGGDEIDDRARQETERIMEGMRSRDPAAREAAAEILKNAAKTQAQSEGGQTAPLRDRLYDALSYRDPGAVIAGRIAFYGGLVLVFAAGVLLYLRTPEGNRGAW